MNVNFPWKRLLKEYIFSRPPVFNFTKKNRGYFPIVLATYHGANIVLNVCFTEHGFLVWLLAKPSFPWSLCIRFPILHADQIAWRNENKTLHASMQSLRESWIVSMNYLSIEVTEAIVSKFSKNMCSGNIRENHKKAFIPEWNFRNSV